MWGLGLFFFSPEDMFIGFREKGGEEEGERNIDARNFNQLPPVHALTGHQTCNLGMCPDQESNP